MAKKTPMSQEGRAREAERQRKMARRFKVGVALSGVCAVAIWGWLLLGG